MRKRRFNHFLKLCNVTGECSILDVGGSCETWMSTPYKKNITILNLSFPKQEERSDDLIYIKGDALDMEMFDDNSFDIVFSNSVIEHVGSQIDQSRFAREIQRVGKSFWVQTPSRHFPIEPHFIFPFFQFLPSDVQKQVAVRWKHSHYKDWNFDNKRILKELALINLLDKRRLLDLFDGASLYEEKLLGVTKSISAYKCAG